MTIEPYSSFDLQNDGLKQVLKAFSFWSKDNDIDFA